MNHTEKSDKSRTAPTETHPNLSEIEVSRLFEEAQKQYEGCMRIADMADISEPMVVRRPRYDWNKPIGLVVTARAKNAWLV